MGPLKMARVRHIDRTEAGQGLVEYGLIILLVSIVSIIALTDLGTAIMDMIVAVTAAF